MSLSKGGERERQLRMSEKLDRIKRAIEQYLISLDCKGSDLDALFSNWLVTTSSKFSYEVFKNESCKEDKESCKEDKESYLDLKSITPMPSPNFINDFNPCVERTIENKCLKNRFSMVNAPNNYTKWILNSGAMDHIMRNPKLLRNSSN
jgi:hypothetical protein